MKAVGLLIVFWASLQETTRAAISAETKAIVNALNAELTAPKLKTYMQKAASMDPAIGSILVYVPRINMGYLCLLNNFDDALNAVRANDGSLNAALDFYLQKCSADPSLVSCLKILQNADTQTRLGAVLLTLFDKFTPEAVTLADDVVDCALSSRPLTKEVVDGFVERFRGLSDATKEGAIGQLPSLKQILRPNGTYYKPYQNELATANYIFGTLVPDADQKTKANNALQKGCQYLHKNFNQYFFYVRDWLSAHSISSRVSMNLTAVASFTASASILAPAGKVLLSAEDTQYSIENFFVECYQI
uniref:Uncharacterized protein n=1 Tax=Panagrolaimus sp. JU765 TaxID=591449 RepID=A0AC34QGF9_9BILA